MFVCKTSMGPKAIPELTIHLPFVVDTCGSVDEDGIQCLRSGILEHSMTAAVFYAAACNTVTWAVCKGQRFTLVPGSGGLRSKSNN